MIVRCIDALFQTDVLVKGREYEVRDERDDCYILSGFDKGFSKTRFEVVSHISDMKMRWRMSAYGRIVLQNSQNAVGSISRKWIKQTAIAERCSPQVITEVAREFIADNVVPQMIICSPRVLPGKFLFSDAKRLLQQYRENSGHSNSMATRPALTHSGLRCQLGIERLAVSCVGRRSPDRRREISL